MLPVPDDRPALAIVPALLGNLLRHKPIVAKLVRTVFVVEEHEADIFPVLADIDFGLVDLGDIDACFNHFVFRICRSSRAILPAVRF